MRFGEYSKDDTINILQLLFKSTNRQIELRAEEDDDDENNSEREFVELDDEFFKGFCEVIYTIFNHNCKDVSELKYIAALLFPLYIKPIRDRQGKRKGGQISTRPKWLKKNHSANGRKSKTVEARATLFCSGNG